MTTMTHELVRIGSRQAGMHSATVWKIPSADSFVLTTLVSSSRRQDETAKTPANTNTSAQNQATDVTLYSKPGSPNTPAPDVVLYLHGFPAQSLDHRQNAYGDVSERFAQKVMEATCGVGLDFCTLNFRGTPGSGGKFFDKTVSGEIADAKAVMQFLKRRSDTTTSTSTDDHSSSSSSSKVHVIGLSTGAIVASLLRGSPNLCASITAVAGCCTIPDALGFDFDESQQKEMQATGACWKDFWLPFGSEDNPKEAELAVAVPGTERTEEEEPEKTEPSENIEPGTFVRHRMRLGKQYTEDFLDLRIEDAVKEGASPRPPPFLVIHGTEDQAVPIREGKRLFEIAAEPKQFVEIPKGNHLLSNSKDMKKAMKEFVSFIAKL